MKTSARYTISEISDGLKTFVVFGTSSSNTTIPSTFSETEPAPALNIFIWRKEGHGLSFDEAVWGNPVCLTGAKGETGEQGPEGETGKLTVEFNSNTITISPLQNIGFIEYNGTQIQISQTSKAFTTGGEGLIIANLNTQEVKFCKLELGETTFNNNTIKTINIIDYENGTLITTRHSSMINYSFLKIGEFIINPGGIVETATITAIEPIDSYFQKAFMKLFKLGDISSSNFEDWLDALDLKNFYQTLVVSTLFVNSLIANDGQFLNSLIISENNIEGTLNNKIDKPDLFKDGITLNPDGSMQANWEGLVNGYPKSGWKISGDGQSFFKGATIIDANVQGLTADHIDHDALTTVDEGDETTIDYTLAKNEWLSNDLFNQFDSNHISRDNYDITCDGASFDYFLKTDNIDLYLINDTNPYTTSIGAGDNKVLHTWTNNYGYPVLVTAKATLEGTNNEIVFDIIDSLYPRILSSRTGTIKRFILFPNETLRCRADSWAWFGSRDAYVNYVRFHKSYNSGKEHLLDTDNRVIAHTTISVTNHTGYGYSLIKTFSVPAWVDYLYIDLGFFSTETRGIAQNTFITYGINDAEINFVYKVNGGTEIGITYYENSLYNHSVSFKIDCRNYNSAITIEFGAKMIAGYRTQEGSSTTYPAYLNYDVINHAYSVELSNNSDSYALFDTTRREKKYFINNTHYKNNIVISADNSTAHLTKVNKADFISGLYNYIYSDLRDSWLILKDATTHYLLIDGVATNIVQLFITSSYIKAILTNGEVATLIQDTRYNSLQIHAISTARVESIETGHIIPKTTNRVIGQAGKEFQSAHINVITAPIIYSSSTDGYFKGKVYAG